MLKYVVELIQTSYQLSNIATRLSAVALISLLLFVILIKSDNVIPLIVVLLGVLVTLVVATGFNAIDSVTVAAIVML